MICDNPDCFQGTIINSPFDPQPTETCPECHPYGANEEPEATFDAERDAPSWIDWSKVPPADWDTPFSD